MSVRIVEKEGTTAPRANDWMEFTLEGPGEIVATDNGDPTSFTSFSSPVREAFNGLCLVIVRGKPNKPGVLTLRAAAPALGKANATVRSVL